MTGLPLLFKISTFSSQTCALCIGRGYKRAPTHSEFSRLWLSVVGTGPVAWWGAGIDPEHPARGPGPGAEASTSARRASQARDPRGNPKENDTILRANVEIKY